MNLLKRFSTRWNGLMQGHGFALLVTLCIGVITATAIWSRQPVRTPVIPTLPPYDDRQASVLRQQSLLDAETPTPLPDSQPLLWLPPLSDMELIRSYSCDTMVQSGATGLWAIHPAVDLRADAGTPVLAMADGRIAACGDDALNGHWIEVEHRNGFSSRYSGLSLLSGLRAGDLVKAGQTLGFVGNGMMEEADLGPHLHLSLQQNGQSVDPMSLLALD